MTEKIRVYKRPDGAWWVTCPRQPDRPFKHWVNAIGHVHVLLRRRQGGPARAVNYGAVAAVANKLTAAGAPVQAGVAEHFNVPTSTVKNWLHHCRRLGLYPAGASVDGRHWECDQCPAARFGTRRELTTHTIQEHERRPNATELIPRTM